MESQDQRRTGDHREHRDKLEYGERVGVGMEALGGEEIVERSRALDQVQASSLGGMYLFPRAT